MYFPFRREIIRLSLTWVEAVFAHDEVYEQHFIYHNNLHIHCLYAQCVLFVSIQFPVSYFSPWPDSHWCTFVTFQSQPEIVPVLRNEKKAFFFGGGGVFVKHLGYFAGGHLWRHNESPSSLLSHFFHSVSEQHQGKLLSVAVFKNVPEKKSLPLTVYYLHQLWCWYFISERQKIRGNQQEVKLHYGQLPEDWFYFILFFAFHTTEPQQTSTTEVEDRRCESLRVIWQAVKLQGVRWENALHILLFSLDDLVTSGNLDKIFSMFGWKFVWWVCPGTIY